MLAVRCKHLNVEHEIDLTLSNKYVTCQIRFDQRKAVFLRDLTKNYLLDLKLNQLIVLKLK